MEGLVERGTATLDGPGNAKLSISAVRGTHTYIAIYGGDSSHAPSTSTVAAINVVEAPIALNITAPVDGAVIKVPGAIPAAATVSVGKQTTITKLEFTLTGPNLTTSTTLTAAPYAYTAAATLAGAYTLEARVTTDSGTVTSKSISFTATLDPDAALVTYFHQDLVGNVVAATDPAGSLLYRESYRPYGDRLVRDSNSELGQIGGNRLWFHGKAEDAETGLQYFGARYYDPVIGRFMGVDPQGASLGNVHSGNRYAYGNNNPYRYTDPDGHSPIDLIFLAVDVYSLGKAIYKGEGVGGALVDVGLSVLGTLSPIPGTGQALKAARTIDKIADTARVVDKVGDSAKAAENGATLVAKGCGCCFRAGTPILAETGSFPIETIQVGQLVYARDAVTGETKLKPVTQLIHTEGKPLFELRLKARDGSVSIMEVTDNHPYWVIGRGWVDSAKLRPGMRVESYDKSALTVQSLKALKRMGLTYNFTVADFHTYFAGEQKAFVHNCACTLAANVAQGKAGEARTKAALGSTLAKEQVTFITSTGVRTRIDFVTKNKGVVETKTGLAQLSPGQRQLKADIVAGRAVTPVGKNAAAAGFKAGKQVKLKSFTEDRQ